MYEELLRYFSKAVVKQLPKKFSEYLPKWVTPVRFAQQIALFERSRGFYVWQERMCTIESHSYEVFIEGLIWDWVRDDRAEDRALWEAERRAMHHDEHTRHLGRQFDSIAKEQFLQQQGAYYLEKLGFNPLTHQRIAVVRVPSSDMRLLVDVTSTVRPLSKNKRRKTWRHGSTPPVEVKRQIDFLCRQAVRAYLAR